MIHPPSNGSSRKLEKKRRYTFCREFNSELNGVFIIDQLSTDRFLSYKDQTQLKILYFLKNQQNQNSDRFNFFETHFFVINAAPASRALKKAQA